MIAHGLSVVVIQAEAERRILPEEQASTREVATIERTAREALVELCQLLGMIRKTEDEPVLGPHPSLKQLDALLQQVREAGLQVELHTEGQDSSLPPGIDLSAYRIVQEGLTNVLRHADGASAEVLIRYRPRELEVEINDNGHGPIGTSNGGHGLIGIRERVQIYGGKLETGSKPIGGLSPVGATPVRCSRVMSVRVLIADDQTLVRADFSKLLEAEPDIDVVGEAVDGTETVEVVRRLGPDLVLMDIRTPKMDGLEATRRILKSAARTRVLILTTYDLDEYVYEALKAGASGFLLKDSPPEQLISAIHVVAAGDALLAPQITRRLIEEFARRPTPRSEPRLAQLTPRETDVLKLLARGLSNGETAAELILGEATVKTHVGHVLTKLDLRDRAQAVVFAYESGLVQPGTA